MDDYKQTMQDLLLQYYSPTPEGGNTVQMQTGAVLNWFRGVIPNEPINQHDVFDTLKELGFKHSQKILKEKVIKKKATKWTEEISEEVEIERVLVWNLYENF